MSARNLWIGVAGSAIVLGGLAWGWWSLRNMGAEKLYKTHCAACHGSAGQGIRKLMPPLAGSDYMAAHWRELPCMIRHGRAGKVVVNGIEYEGNMPAASGALKPQEMVVLLNFIGSNWGNNLPRVSFAQVDSALKTCK